MESVIYVIHLVASLSLIGLVLLQQGKGADMGAAFGAGASGTVFGARGSASFLTRATAIVATVFFITSLSLAFFVNKGVEADSLEQDLQGMGVEQVESEVPVISGAGEEPQAVPVPGADVPAIESEVPAVPTEGGSQ